MRCCVLTVLFGMTILGTIRADQGLALPTPSALEKHMLADAENGTLEEFTLLEAAFIASGVCQQEELTRRTRAFEQAWNTFAPTLPREPARRAQHVFRFLHDEILNGDYQADCTDLRRTQDEGHYNCVTATVLFQILCQKSRIESHAVATPEHVFSRLSHVGTVDVETTCPTWFELGPRSSRLRDLRSDDSPAATRLISDVQLLAKIYYNLGRERLMRGEFPEAVQAIRISSQLDPQDRAARDNLLAALNNWSLAESDRAHYARAAEILASGMQLDAHYGPFLANDLHIHQRWAVALCAKGDFRAAHALLEECFQRRSDVALFDKGRFAVVALWLQDLLAQGRQDEAWRLLEQLRQRSPQRQEIQLCEEAAICQAVDLLLRQGRFREAAALSAAGVSRRPESRRLQQQHRGLTATRS